MTLSRYRRTGIVLGLVVLGVVALGWLSREMRSVTFQREDMFTGLVYYMEAHDGVLPPNRDSFLQSDFVEVSSDSAFRVLRNSASQYRPNVYGVRVSKRFLDGVAWGRDVSALQITPDRQVCDGDGRTVLLVGADGELGQVAMDYTAAIVEISQEIRAAKRE